MALTPLVLVFVGSIALLATVGMFVDYDDRWTRVLVAFVAATVWAIVGLSAYDVALPHTDPVQTETMLPLVYLGIGFAFLTALFGVYEMVTGFGKEAGDTDLGTMMDR